MVYLFFAQFLTHSQVLFYYSIKNVEACNLEALKDLVLVLLAAAAVERRLC